MVLYSHLRFLNTCTDDIIFKYIFLKELQEKLHKATRRLSSLTVIHNKDNEDVLVKTEPSK